MSQQLSNPHYLYLHSSIATQSQVENYIRFLLGQFEKILNTKLNKEFIVNTVTKYDGTPLKHSYVWFKSVQSAHLLLNKDLSGNDRVEEYPDLDHDTTEDEKRLNDFLCQPTQPGDRWEDLTEIEENLVKKTMKRMIRKSMPTMFEFPPIEPTEEQKIKYPEKTKIEVSFYPCNITGRKNVSYQKLFAIHVNKDVTEGQIRKHFEPFAITKHANDKKDYPLVHIDRKSCPTSVVVSYAPCSMDGIFALCMVKKVLINEKCTLNFDLYREN